ncbi:MAG: DUF1015 domain-containing protein [Bacilli bacterium]|nr:DUF1015 domain-containing protein [Bacilli bacterium]MBN2877116.1 DUF1015 domain-containing protein [Bacilli bacterium]
MSIVTTPTILLPRPSINKETWSVIACDQFTSEPEYWEQLKSLVDNVPSTYHLILPEAFLEEDMEYQIVKVNETMDRYLRNHIFEEHKGFILIDRKTPFVKRRLGLIIAIDLEEYEFEPHKNGRIRATEKTVPERIPPRVHIRQKAPIELPHVLTLVDDKTDKIIEELYQKRKQYELLYDFNLNMNGGHVRGYLIPETQPIIDRLESLHDDISLIVGDGNHSLAAAKVCWDNLKNNLQEEERLTHPARYALVELISLYDEGLTFEPIHRILFDVDDDLIQGLKETLSGDSQLSIFRGNVEIKLNVPDNPFTTIKQIQQFLDDYLETHSEASIDFIHGIKNLRSLVEKTKGSIAISMPPLQRDLLLPYIREYGVLPRKSFSLGEAEEKRYYLEGKRIL